MKTSQRGIDLIKTFEGFSSKAVKLQGEMYYTWGYGHYGADVPPNGTISRSQAETLLRKDLVRFEKWVNDYVRFPMNQNQFDALVSFTYNCGPGSLGTLVKNRNASQAAAHWMAYTNSGSEAYREGLRRRREKELALFNTKEDNEVVEASKIIIDGKTYEVNRILKDNTNYLPIRRIAELLGLEVGYDPKGSIPILKTK